MDWAHIAGMDIAYTVELRDTENYGFLLPESQIRGTCGEYCLHARDLQRRPNLAQNGSVLLSCQIRSVDTSKSKVFCTCKPGYVQLNRVCFVEVMMVCLSAGLSYK